jgi:hypothetical protein
VASSIDHLGGDVVSGVETQGWRGTPGECRVVDDGIGEEGGAVVELEDVTVAQCRAESACDGWGGVVGASTGGNAALN